MNGEYKLLNNGGSCDNRSGRESYDELKYCHKTTTDINSPLNRSMTRYRDEDYHLSVDLMDCQFSPYGCNFRTIDVNQLNIHNEENIPGHLNVSFLIKYIYIYLPWMFGIFFFFGF